MSNNQKLTFDVSLNDGEDFTSATSGVSIMVDGLKTPAGEKIGLTVGFKPEQITLSAFSESISALAAGNQVFDGSIAYDDLVRDITGDVTTKQVLEQALYWLEAEAANPGQAKPDEILKVIRKALGLNPNEMANDLPAAPASEADVFKGDAEKTMYLPAFSVADGLSDPEFASILLDAQVLDLITKLKCLVEQNRFLTEARAFAEVLWAPDSEGNGTLDEPLSIDEVVVFRSGFWFRSAGKHGGAIETRIVSWSLLKWVLSQKETAIFMPDSDIDPSIEGGRKLKQLIEDAWENSEATDED